MRNLTAIKVTREKRTSETIILRFPTPAPLPPTQILPSHYLSPLSPRCLHPPFVRGLKEEFLGIPKYTFEMVINLSSRPLVSVQDVPVTRLACAGKKTDTYLVLTCYRDLPHPVKLLLPKTWKPFRDFEENC